MPRYSGLGLILAAALVVLSGCSNSAIDLPQMDAASVTNGPALIAKQEATSSNPPEFSGAEQNTPNDLVSMTAEEEVGYSLFCDQLSETQYRYLLQNDGTGIVPNRLVTYDKQFYAYYNNNKQDLVVCSTALDWFCNIFSNISISAKGRILDAQWLDAEKLLVLAGDETLQSIYVFYPANRTLSIAYTSPLDKEILGMTVNSDGTVECEVAARRATKDEPDATQTVDSQSESQAVPSTQNGEKTNDALPQEDKQTVLVPIE